MKKLIHKKLKLKFLVTFMIMTSILTLIPRQALATTYGGKWITTIKYYFQDKSSYNNYYQLVKLAGDIWNSELLNLYSDVTFKEVTSISDANVIIRIGSAPGALAYTQVGPNKYSGIYTNGEVILNDYNMSAYSQEENEKVIIHEFGHLLGFNHAPDGVNSIMTVDPTKPNVNTWPTSYDLSELRKLYYKKI